MLLALLVCLALGTQAATTPPQLTADSFQNSIVSSDQRWFVFFFSPHCGHCRAMEPAWDELAAMAGLGSVVNLATVDATEERGLAEKLDVNGYPTLLVFGGATAAHAVFEYEGDRSTASLHAFATAADLASAGGRRRGYLSADGTVRPSRVDVLLRVPNEMFEIVGIALGTSRVATLLLATCLVTLGVLLALLTTPSPPVPFLVVECPPGVQPGQTFAVEVTTSGGSPRLLAWLGRRRRRVMNVAAPAGVREGQSFFVPLVAPPKASAAKKDE